MLDFREKVKKLREEKTNQFFTNGGTERSLITLTEIFKGAETNICVFAETLSDLSSGTTKNPATEEQYREELCAFLNRRVDAWGLNELSVQEIEDKWASSTPLLRILIKEEYNGKDVAETFRHTRLAVRIKEEIEKQKNKIETRLKEIKIPKEKVEGLVDRISQKMCCIKTTKRVVEMHIGDEKRTVNFTIADDRMMRIEYDLDFRRALCNFSAPKQVNDLMSIYNNIWEQAKDIYDDWLE